MNDDSHPPRDTQEFVAGWQSIVEEHVVNLPELGDVLRGLTEKDPSGKLLARHVTHALQIAASPDGSVQAAVHYLRQSAADAEPSGQS